LVFSGHKLLGPTGIGVLFAREALHVHMHPFRYGGGMVRAIGDDNCFWVDAPHKFEAGTPPVAQALGLAAAIEYLTATITFAELRAHESQLVSSAIQGLLACKRVRILGPIDQLLHEGHVVSFVVDGVHAHDVAAFLDSQTPSIAVRAGQHCAQAFHEALKIPASVRLSFYLYNTKEEVDFFVQSMKRLLS